MCALALAMYWSLFVGVEWWGKFQIYIKVNAPNVKEQ